MAKRPKPTCDPRCNPVQIPAIGPGWTGHVAACKYFGTGKRGSPAPRKKPAKVERWSFSGREIAYSVPGVQAIRSLTLSEDADVFEQAFAIEIVKAANSAGLVLPARKR